MYRDLVSGRPLGPCVTFVRMLLVFLSWPYSLAVRLRNGLYSAGLLRARKVPAAVISVGNLTVGGTGKTPLVAWLAKKLQSKGLRVAILTRGYRATNHKSEIENQKYDDEPALLAAGCPGVNVVVNPDRIAGAKRAIDEHYAEVLLLDDGFQHRRLARDIDIVTIDATAPFGYGRLLPAGLLREPISGLRRADAVVITRSDQVSEESLAQIEGQAHRINPDAIIATSIHAPVNAITSGDAEIGLDELRGKRVYAFCGLGNPQAFFDTVRHIGCVLVGCRSLDDHHAYTGDCLGEVRRQAATQNVDYIVTTQKDWTKIAGLISPANDPPMVYLAVEMEFVTGSEQLTALIDRVVDSKMSSVSKSGQQEA